MASLRRFVHELHRRSLWQVLGVYLVGCWVAYQVVLGLVDGLGLPDWVAPFAIVLFVIGLPVVLATAFVQEGLPGRAGYPASSPGPAADSAAATAAPSADRRGDAGPADRRADRRADLRGDRTAPAPATRRAPALFTWRGAITGGVLAFAVLGLGVTGFMGMRSLGIGPAGSLVGKGELAASDHVLVADFNPLTGDSAMASVVAEALRVDLTQSALLNVVDRARIREALARMERADEGPLKGPLAREVAYRLGAKAVVEGEVGGAGGAYLISATLVTPDSGRVLASFRETAADSTDLLPAVDRLTRKLREKAGESLRSIRANPPLTQVTTASLPALRKYVRARELSDRGDRSAPMALLEEALALDPEFASAHRSMAVHLWNRGMRGDSMFHHINEALRLGERLTDYERHHARGFRAVTTYDLDVARREYETLLAMDSADVTALINLGVVYIFAGQPARSLEMAERAHALGNRAIGTTYWNIVQGHLNLGQYDRADSVIALAAADHPRSGAIPFMRWLVAMARGDSAAAEEAERILAMETEEPEPARHLRSLRNIQAGRLSGATPPEPDDALDSLWVAIPVGYIDLFVLREPDDAAERVLRAVASPGLADVPTSERPYPQLALIQALAGRSGAALELARSFREAVRPELLRQHEGMLAAAEGLADIMEGRTEAGLTRLRSARRLSGCRDCTEAVRGIAFEAAALPDSAIAAFERYLALHWADRHHFQWSYPNDPFIRAHIHERLAGLYEDAGRHEDARRHLSAFIRQWAGADPALQPRVGAARNRLEALTGER